MNFIISPNDNSLLDKMLNFIEICKEFDIISDDDDIDYEDFNVYFHLVIRNKEICECIVDIDNDIDGFIVKQIDEFKYKNKTIYELLRYKENN